MKAGSFTIYNVTIACIVSVVVRSYGLYLRQLQWRLISPYLKVGVLRYAAPDKWTYGFNGKEFLSEVYDDHADDYQHIWFDPVAEAVIPITMPGIPTQKVSCEIYLGDWIVWTECPSQPTPVGLGWSVNALNLTSGERLVIDQDAGVEINVPRVKIQQPLNLSGDASRFVYTAFATDSEGATC